MVIWNAIVKWFYGFCGIDIIMDAISKNEPVPVQGYVQLVFSGLLAVLGILSCYRVFYLFLGYLAAVVDTQKPPKTNATLSSSQPGMKKPSSATSSVISVRSIIRRN